MTDARDLTSVYVSLAVAAALVVLAVFLLLAFLAVTRSIERRAKEVSQRVSAIRRNTRVILALKDNRASGVKAVGGSEPVARRAGNIALGLREADIDSGMAKG